MVGPTALLEECCGLDLRASGITVEFPCSLCSVPPVPRNPLSCSLGSPAYSHSPNCQSALTLVFPLCDPALSWQFLLSVPCLCSIILPKNLFYSSTRNLALVRICYCFGLCLYNIAKTTVSPLLPRAKSCLRTPRTTSYTFANFF